MFSFFRWEKYVVVHDIGRQGQNLINEGLPTENIWHFTENKEYQDSLTDSLQQTKTLVNYHGHATLHCYHAPSPFFTY